MTGDIIDVLSYRARVMIGVLNATTAAGQVEGSDAVVVELEEVT